MTVLSNLLKYSRAADLLEEEGRGSERRRVEEERDDALARLPERRCREVQLRLRVSGLELQRGATVRRIYVRPIHFGIAQVQA